MTRLAAPIDLYFLSVIAIIRIVSWIPFRRARIAVARLLAELSYRLSRKKRAVIERAVVMALGERITSRELSRIVRGSLFDTWYELLVSVPNGIDRRVVENAQVVGWEHLERALARGRGVILWEMGSFGRRSWMKQILSRRGVRVHQVHGANHLNGLAAESTTATWVRHNVIRPFFDDAERRFVAEQIVLPTSGDLAYARTFLRNLRARAVLCVAADGAEGARLQVVPLLGTRYRFSTGMVSLARASGAPLVPIVCRETEDGGARLIIEEAAVVGEEGDRDRQNERIVARYADMMESYIRREPARCRNWHVIAQVAEEIARNEARPEDGARREAAPSAPA